MGEAISAGDVGRFVYCPLNWKRSLAGDRGAGGEAGVRAHVEVSKEVDALEHYQSRAHLALETSFYLALFAMSGAALGVELFALRPRDPWWWALVFLSVLWMGASLHLFVFHQYYQGRARTIARSSQVARGTVIYADSRRRPDVLESRVLPLRGRPDYVVERDGHPIPVEFKSGRTPRQPYDSHVLQLAAYCYLVSESFGLRPPYGILAYPDRQFEVPFTRELEDRLLRTLLRIQLSQRTGEAHRDHESPRRCQTCSRREGCPERLA